jgi:hypothetical protein
VLKSLVMFRDPGLLRLEPEHCGEAVGVVHGHGQGAVLVHVEDEAQSAVATDACVRARPEPGQVALPGVEVLLEQEEFKPGVNEVGGGQPVSTPGW